MPLCCVLLAFCGRGVECWDEGVGTNVTRPSSRGVERLGDDYREHGENNRWSCWGEGVEGGVRFVRIFFIILSRAVNSRGLAAFRDGFRKGLGLNFFFLQLRSIGRKRGKGFGEWRAWFLILKLYGFNFPEWCEGRDVSCYFYAFLYF